MEKLDIEAIVEALEWKYNQASSCRCWLCFTAYESERVCRLAFATDDWKFRADVSTIGDFGFEIEFSAELLEKIWALFSQPLEGNPVWRHCLKQLLVVKAVDLLRQVPEAEDVVQEAFEKLANCGLDTLVQTRLSRQLEDFRIDDFGKLLLEKTVSGS